MPVGEHGRRRHPVGPCESHDVPGVARRRRSSSGTLGGEEGLITLTFLGRAQHARQPVECEWRPIETNPYTMIANRIETSNTDSSDSVIESKIPRNGAIARWVER